MATRKTSAKNSTARRIAKRPAHVRRTAPAKQPVQVKQPVQAKRPAQPKRPAQVKPPAQARRPVQAKRPAQVNPAQAANGHDLQRAVEQFIYQQSELLDGKRWQAFIDLFAPDGVYWMPSLPEHTHWDGVPAIFVEDKDLMTVRMKRITHPQAWSQQAEWGTNHVVSNVTIDRTDPKTGEIQVRSRFHMMELRRDDLRHFGGTYQHRLISTKDGFRIKVMRVDLMNAQAPYEYVIQAWV